MSSQPDLTQKVPPEKQAPLHLITQSTPNGVKVQIALEEYKAIYGTEFSVEVINIGTNVQKQDWFLKLNPNGRIPTLVDNKPENGSSKPFAVMESAAILLYLLKRVDKKNILGFTDDLEQSEALQWMAGLGPMQGQLNHFNLYAPQKIPYAITRYHDETFRLLDVIEIQLSGRLSGQEKEYLAGPGKGKYSIADIVSFPWARIAKRSGIEDELLAKLPHVQAWIKRIEERPAVQIAIGDKYQLK